MPISRHLKVFAGLQFTFQVEFQHALYSTPRRPAMAVMPRSLLLLLLLASPFFFLLSHSSSAYLSDFNPNYIIKNVTNDHRDDQQVFAADDDSPQADPEVVNEAHVVLLTAANFSSFLDACHHVMVDFYAPWCYWSRKLAPVYAAVASHLVHKGLDVALAKVDATKDRDLARAHGVDGHPTVLSFIDGVPRRYPYYGEMTKDAIVTWISQRLASAVQNVTTIDQAEKIITGGKVAVLAFLNSLSGAHGDELAAASRLEDINSFYQPANFYQTTSPDVAKLFHIDPEAKRPSLVLLKKDEEKLTIYDGEFRASAIAEFVSANKIPSITHHPYTGSRHFGF